MKKTNQRIKILMLIFILSVFVYINFVTGYFSGDSVKIFNMGYKEYATNYSLYDGRIFMYLILNVAQALNLNVKTFYIILLILSLFVSSISALMLYEIINNFKTETTKKNKILLMLLCYCYIFNFTYIDNMRFVECIIMSISILLFILAAKKVILDKRPIIGCIICFLGILFYQGTINVFVTTSILFLTLKRNEYKLIIKEIMILGIVTLIAVSLDIIIVKTIQIFVESLQINRLDFSNIITNIENIIANLPLLINNSLKLFPQFWQIIITIIITVLMYIYSIKYNKMKEFWILLILIAISYFSCLIMGVAYKDLIFIGNGRMFNSVGAQISVILIYMYIKTDIFKYKTLGKCVSTLIVIYFIINLTNTIYMTKIRKSSNERDREISLKIKTETEKNNINKYAVFDILTEKDLKEAERWKAYVYNNDSYELYTGEKKERVSFEDEVIEEYFKEEQEGMVVVDDVLYVVY